MPGPELTNVGTPPEHAPTAGRELLTLLMLLLVSAVLLVLCWGGAAWWVHN